MTNPNQILKSIKEANKLSGKYDIPSIDILLMGLNIAGIWNAKLPNAVRVRFEMNPKEEYTKKGPFFFAVTNTKEAGWKYENENIIFDGIAIGKAGQAKNDTCDNTYFRRFDSVEGRRLGTELTINSNQRSGCVGCGFCGTYKLDPKDAAEKDLTTPDKLRKKIQKIIETQKLKDLSHLVEVGIVTGCFKDEKSAVNHLLMISDVLRGEFGFKEELKYVGSQVKSPQALEELAKYASPFGISLTVECFERRDDLIKNSKRIPLDHGRELLSNAKEAGIRTTILYIMGLDSLDTFEKEIAKYVPILTKLPVINTMQDYTGMQHKLRHPDAGNMEYYLKARRIVEDMFQKTNFVPNVWENYRGLFFTEYRGKSLDTIKI